MNFFEKKQMGQLIKKLREDRGLTQGDLAKILGMKNRATISSYEAGRAIPPSDVLRNLADVFEVTTDYILGRDESNLFVKPQRDESSIDTTDFGWAIKEERQNQGLTQKELGNLVGEHQRQISNYELGLKPIPEVTLEKIVEVFGMSFPAFLNKYNLWDEPIHPHFDGDVDKQIAYDKAVYEDAMRDPGYDTIAAHHDGDDWSEDELEEIEKFKEFLKLKRKHQE